MIDLESVVFTTIAKDLRETFNGIVVMGEYVNAPSRFPFVSVVEADNYIDARYIDSADTERYATVMYEVNVYSDKSSAKKAECRKILAHIDAMLYRMNFTRISMNPVPNMEDASIYRLNARYEAVTDGKTTFRR